MCCFKSFYEFTYLNQNKFRKDYFVSVIVGV